MIFSIVIRNYKTYRGWSYIPLSLNNSLSAILGDNGIGKSSITEAIEVFFDNPIGEWNVNHSISKSGFNEREPEICPVFLIKKSEINKNRNIYKQMETVSNITWQTEKESFNISLHKHIERVIDHISCVKNKIPNIDSEFFLLPCGFKKTDQRKSQMSMAIFENNESYKEDLAAEHNTDIENFLTELYSHIKDNFEYLNIPSEVDYATYTKLEGKTSQTLMGTTVDNIIKLTIDKDVIKQINTGLDEFISNVGAKLEKYEYKKPAQRQTLFNLSHLTSKVIETYFESKILNLKNGNEFTPIYDCSSGEKRKALVDIALAFISSSDEHNRSKKLIVAIDEPEISLHISSCFEQFEKLEKISKNGVQVIICTHWYGFFPSVSSGTATYIGEKSGEKSSIIIPLETFREDIRRSHSSMGELSPLSIELKTINDLTQSIISSISRSDTCWIICEGASDKIYLDHYFENNDKIKIVSAGGGKYVKKIFECLYLVLDEARSDVKGKALFLLDTDKNYEPYTPKESVKKIEIRRLQNSKTDGMTQLNKTTDTNIYPPTEMEDTLDIQIFIETAKKLQSESFDIKFLSNIEILQDEIRPTGLSLNLRPTEEEKLDDFFNTIGMKTKFAKNYCKNDTNKKKTSLILAIEKFIAN